MSDTQDRRATLLDSATQMADKHGALAILNVHCLLLELFEVVDAQKRSAAAIEKIAAALHKIANPMMVAQAELPLRDRDAILPGSVSYTDGKPRPVVPLGQT